MFTLRENGYLNWQREAVAVIHNQMADVLLLTGGFGSGKTAVNAHIVKDICRHKHFAVTRDRGRRGVVISSTYDTLKDTVGVTLDDELTNQLIVRRKRSAPYSWHIKSKYGTGELLSRAMRYDHESFPRLKSINADYLWLVEATELPREAFVVGVSRLRRLGEQTYSPILIETNPSSKSNWVYETFIKDSREIFRSPDNTWWVELKRTEVVDPETNELRLLRTVIFNTTTFANPHYPRARIASMQSMYSPAEFQRLIYGVWNSLEDRVIEVYTVFPRPVDLKAHGAKYDFLVLGCDPGDTDPTAVVFIGVRGGVFEIFDEISLKQRSIRAIHQEVMLRLETWGLTNFRPDIWVDPSDSGWIREWNLIDGQTMHAYSATHRGTDPVLNRYTRIAERFRIKTIQICEHCKETIRDCESMVFAKGSSRTKIDKETYNPHRLDAAGYGLARHL